jgi:ribosomal protein S18 acetylase RimI-like enzyme
MRRDLSVPITPVPMPMGVTLAAFDAVNARASCELMNRAYGTSNGNVPEPFDKWWASLIGDPEYDPSLMYPVMQQGEVVGFCHGWSVPFVKDLVVAPEFRRRGLGGALLTMALQEFHRRGATSVDLKTDIDNEKAQSLYRRLGFVIVERVDD